MHIARRTHGFQESVIRGMTRLAAAHGAINLAQGFPDFPCPDVLKEAAVEALRADRNQYAITCWSRSAPPASAARRRRGRTTCWRTTPSSRRSTTSPSHGS